MFQWFNFLLYAVSTAATPGPNNIMSMTNGGHLGFKKALPFNFGIWVGFSLVMILCTLFCATLASYIPLVKMPLLIIGAIYMLYLARSTYKSSSKLKKGTGGSGFISGFILQFVNPKIYIYGIMSMEAYILPYYSQEPLTLLKFAMFLAFIGFAFTLGWSAFGALFNLLFTKYAKIVNTIMSLLLVYCAISLFQ
ncbi:Cysteine/O-acetylserine efflux protein [bioreactor metagenome]|jgi:Putative threonine efflux protein|uniref:Cysteine/O-acetylserine efflux protein n=1 Tax=bioreactor metagenome TaxID=1076179 RepID=A0A644VK76_9ZZZZ|nr:LysE family transporter [Acholeplasmataceae bacterium]